MQKDWGSIFETCFAGCPINHSSKRKIDTALADTVSADIDMLWDHPSKTEGKLSLQLTTRMSLGKAALPTHCISNCQFSPWHFANIAKPVHICRSRYIKGVNRGHWLQVLGDFLPTWRSVACGAREKPLLESSFWSVQTSNCSFYVADEPTQLDNWELAEVYPWLRLKHTQQLSFTSVIAWTQ